MDQCEYADEDIISVYSFTNHSLIVTRNRFLLIAVHEGSYSVKCNILFEELVTIRKQVERNVELWFICMNRGTLFQKPNDFSPFGLRFEEKKIKIGRGHSASRVADMLCEIIEKEITHHDGCRIWTIY